MKKQNHLYIDGKRMNIIGTPVPAPHGFYKVRVGEASVPTAEHSIPALFMDGTHGRVLTGGCVYSWQPDQVKEPAPRRPAVELQVIPTLSNSHISGDAANWLIGIGDDHSALILAKYDAGWFLRVLLDHDKVEEIPQSIREVATWAKAQGYDWVRLDRDVNPIDGLTTYSW